MRAGKLRRRPTKKQIQWGTQAKVDWLGDKKKLPNYGLTEILLAGDEKYEHGQDHNRVAVIVTIDKVIVVFVHERLHLVQNRT